MQIITIDDREFDDLLNAWRSGLQVGKFLRNGKTQIVCATRHFMLISNEDNPEKIALKPTRSQAEAVDLALQLLSKEESFGNKVERSETPYSKQDEVS